MYKKILKEKDIQAIIITDPINMRYISGFSGGEGALYLSSNREVLITDSRYTEAAAKESSFEIIEENAAHKRMRILSELAESDGVCSIGFEDNAMTYGMYIKYTAALMQVKSWIPLGSAVDNLRLIKSDKEIALMQKASEIADYAFIRTCERIRIGMTELEGAAEIEYQMKQAGAEDVSFATIFAAGKHSSMPHAVPTDYKIQRGDFITIDFGCKYNGYCSDTTRTIVVGEPSWKQREIYEIVLEAHNRALAAVKPGVQGKDIDGEARAVITAAGYGEYFGHSTGHAVGLYIHEEPRFSAASETIYKAGMTGTIEPGIYLPGEFGVRIEDMIVITDEGCRSFTRLPKKLIILNQ